MTDRYGRRTITIGDPQSSSEGVVSFEIFEGSRVIGKMTREPSGSYRATDRSGTDRGVHARMTDAATAVAEQS